MKSLKEFILEGAKLDDKLAKTIMNNVKADNKDLDIEEIKKEMEKYDYDMNIILKTIDYPSKNTHLDKTEELLNAIWAYLEEKYPNDCSNYYDFISQKLPDFLD